MEKVDVIKLLTERLDGETDYTVLGNPNLSIMGIWKTEIEE